MSQQGSQVQWIEVGPEDAGQRLDNFLMRHLRKAPRALIYRIVRKGEVRINKKRAKVSDRIHAGDVVRIPPVKLAPSAAEKQLDAQAIGRFESIVLYEDAAILVVDKPSGLPVHGGSGLSWGLIELVRAARPEAKRLELVHRLDRDTSGVILLAKKAQVLKALHAQVRENRMKKVYQALVAGFWQAKQRKIDLPLKKNILSAKERVVCVDATGKPSVSYFQRLRGCDAASWMQLRLKTGRTHQIRVHAQAAGHPLLGDDKYGDRAANKRAKQCGLNRLALHAWQLGFEHPDTGQWMELEAPVPSVFKQSYECLCKQKPTNS